MLTSCAVVHDKEQDFQIPAETSGSQKFSAWKQPGQSPGSEVANKAVQELLQQADELIAGNEIDHASDKLERLLRIEPNSAQAWSRLSWISLEKNMAKRALQMAKRSNSYANDNKNLKLLNWSFIREAAQQTGDDVMIRRAEEMIKSLEPWGGF